MREQECFKVLNDPDYDGDNDEINASGAKVDKDDVPTAPVVIAPEPLLEGKPVKAKSAKNKKND